MTVKWIHCTMGTVCLSFSQETEHHYELLHHCSFPTWATWLSLSFCSEFCTNFTSSDRPSLNIPSKIAPFACYSVSLISSVAQSCPTLCDSMNHSTLGLPVQQQLTEFTQTHVHRVGDATQSSHPLSSPSPPAPNPSQHQSLFQWVSSSHEVAKVLEFQLQHQSFQWTRRTDLL